MIIVPGLRIIKIMRIIWQNIGRANKYDHPFLLRESISLSIGSSNKVPQFGFAKFTREQPF